MLCITYNNIYFIKIYNSYSFYYIGLHEIPIYETDENGEITKENHEAYEKYIEKNIVSEKSNDTVMRLFQKEMNILQEIYTCSSCGERGFKSQVFTELININYLEIFILPKDKVEIIINKPLCQQKAYQLYYNENNNNYYYLLPHLISEKRNNNNDIEVFFPICMKCIKEMKNNKPGHKYSIAHNENYGRYSLCSEDGIDIKELTMVDKMAICPIRLLQTTLRLNNPINKKKTKNESSTYKIEGHCISFECEHLTLQEKNVIKNIEKDYILDDNSKINLPNIDMNSRMQVIFT